MAAVVRLAGRGQGCAHHEGIKLRSACSVVAGWEECLRDGVGKQLYVITRLDNVQNFITIQHCPLIHTRFRSPSADGACFAMVITYRLSPIYGGQLKKVIQAQRALIGTTCHGLRELLPCMTLASILPPRGSYNG